MKVNDKSITNVSLDVPKGHTVKIVKESDLNISYIMVGSGAKNMKSKLTSINIIKAMRGMTSPEQYATEVLQDTSRWIRDEITDEMYSDGISYIPAKYWERDGDKRTFVRGIKGLREKGLAIKLNKTQYMANPLMIIPTRKLDAIKQWNISCEPEHKITRDD